MLLDYSPYTTKARTALLTHYAALRKMCIRVFYLYDSIEKVYRKTLDMPKSHVLVEKNTLSLGL